MTFAFLSEQNYITARAVISRKLTIYAEIIPAFLNTFLLTEPGWRKAGSLFEQRTERREAIESDSMTYRGYRLVCFRQPIFGLSDPDVDEVLMRRYIECLFEKPQKVMGILHGYVGNLIHGEG
jgi:hypothetical protein